MKRLLDESPDDFASELLRSAETDTPSAAARDRAIEAATSAASAGPAKPAWLKGTGIAGASGVAVVIALRLLSGQPAAEPPKSGGAATATTSGATAPAPAPAETATATATSAEPTRVVAPEPPPASNPPPIASSRVAAPKASGHRAGADESDSLARELAALDRARASLAASDASGALREIASYKRAFPAGAMRQEALALEVDATFAKGDDTGARKLAAAFLAAFPDSPQAPRIRRRLERP